MSKSTITFLAVITFLILSQQVTAETIVTADGKTIGISYYRPPSEGAPAVVLIPATPCDRSEYRYLPSRMQKAGFAVVTMDMRYKELMHAERRSREEAIRTLQSQDLYAPVNYDVKAVLSYLAGKKEIDQTRIVLLGGEFRVASRH
jgi:dienelactone hydrolase